MKQPLSRNSLRKWKLKKAAMDNWTRNLRFQYKARKIAKALLEEADVRVASAKAALKRAL